MKNAGQLPAILQAIRGGYEEWTNRFMLTLSDINLHITEDGIT